MAWSESAVTTAGAALLTASVSGALLTITSAAGGTGTEAVEDLPSMTELTNQVQAFTVKSIEDVSEGKKIKFLISNAGIEEAYTMQQVGVWAKLQNDEDETLLMVIQDSNGLEVPSEDDVQDFAIEMFVILKISSTANIDITVDSTALVSVADFEILQAEVTALHDTATTESDGLMSASDKAKMDAIKLGYDIYNSVEELGITSGFATLQSAWSALPVNAMLLAPSSDFTAASSPTSNMFLIEITKPDTPYQYLGRIMAYPRDLTTHIYRMGLYGNTACTPSGTWEAIAFTSEIGDLASLTTTAKTSAVAAINELDSGLDTLNSKFAVSSITLTNRTTNGYGEISNTGLTTSNAAVLATTTVGGGDFYICIPFLFGNAWYIRVLDNNGSRLASRNVGDITIYYIAL